MDALTWTRGSTCGVCKTEIKPNQRYILHSLDKNGKKKFLQHVLCTEWGKAQDRFFKNAKPKGKMKYDYT